MITPLHAARRRMARVTDRLQVLPVLVLMPHGSCDCRCVMCDIWRANSERRELSCAELAAHVEPLRRLQVQRIVLSGGEALLHSNLWELSDLLAQTGARLTLLTTGQSLARHAEAVSHRFDEVIVSLDGPQPVHDRIRAVEGAYRRLADGLEVLRRCDAQPKLRARCVIQRANYTQMEAIALSARELGLDQVSFLAADVSTTAFNRPEPWSTERLESVSLRDDEVAELRRLIERFVTVHRADIASGFIAESAAKLRQLADYFAALNNAGPFPPPRCNAPWVSAVIEADGEVKPCFFHPAYGTLGDGSLADTVNSPAAIAFRAQLDVGKDPICQRCVCSLYLSPTAPV